MIDPNRHFPFKMIAWSQCHDGSECVQGIGQTQPRFRTEETVFRRGIKDKVEAIGGSLRRSGLHQFALSDLDLKSTGITDANGRLFRGKVPDYEIVKARIGKQNPLTKT